MNIISIQKYTKKVKMMKNTIALIVVLLLLYIISLLFILPNSDRIKIVYSHALNEGDKLKIIKPTLYGLSNKNEVFKVTASSGVQSSDDKGKDFLFNNVVGKIVMNRDSSTVTLTADKGIIYPSQESMNLLGNVAIKSTSKYQAETDEATISLENYDVWGEVPISMSSQYGAITASKFHFFNNKQTIVFEGNVVTVIK